MSLRTCARRRRQISLFFLNELDKIISDNSPFKFNFPFALLIGVVVVTVIKPLFRTKMTDLPRSNGEKLLNRLARMDERYHR